MTNGEAAAAQGLSHAAASKRYAQAMERPRAILAAVPGEASEP